MPTNKNIKQPKGEYFASYRRTIDPNPFVFEGTAGLNKPQLDQNISIQT